MNGPANDNALPRDATSISRPCPICGKPAVATARPFCSKRCADVDLHRWLGGTYRVPAESVDDDDGSEAADP